MWTRNTSHNRTNNGLYILTCDYTQLFFSLSSPSVISFLVRRVSLFKIIILKRESVDIINSNVLLGVCAVFSPNGLFDYIYASIIKQAKSVSISVKSIVRFPNSPKEHLWLRVILTREALLLELT